MSYGAAVGRRANGISYGTAMGTGANAYDYGVAVGAYASGNSSGVAIGVNAIATGGVGRVAIGHNTLNDVDDSVRLRGTLYLDGSTQWIYYRWPAGSGGWTAKLFVIDHPLDPENKLLRHACLEGPVVQNVYNGTVVLDLNGEARVQLPAYFESLNRNPQYLLTAVSASMPGLFVKQKIRENTFVIGGGLPGGEVCWEVKGERNDPALRANPLVVEETKTLPGRIHKSWQDPCGAARRLD